MHILWVKSKKWSARYFLKYAKIRLENMNYQVYFTGAKFTYNNEIRQVQDNEYMIAIKEGKKYGYKC